MKRQKLRGGVLDWERHINQPAVFGDAEMISRAEGYPAFRLGDNDGNRLLWKCLGNAMPWTVIGDAEDVGVGEGR